MTEGQEKGEQPYFVRLAEEVLVNATETLTSFDTISSLYPLCRAKERMKNLEYDFGKLGWTARGLRIWVPPGLNMEVVDDAQASKTEKAADAADDAKTDGGMDVDGFEWKASDASLGDIIDEAFAQQQGSMAASSGEIPKAKRVRKGRKTKEVE